MIFIKKEQIAYLLFMIVGIIIDIINNIIII